ncbi:hypothetical protein DYB25_004911, partial [Aphanomyces astaci]
VIILGDGAVGKTSIAMRHTEDSFSNVYKQTIGLDFYLKRLSLPGKHIHIHERRQGSFAYGLLTLPCDLNHLRTVKAAKHKQFADENDMKSYMLSAKTGDQVNSTFFQLAADLAGVIVTRPEVEVTSPAVKATIINHDQNDPDVKAPDMRKNSKGCSIQ